MHKHRSISLDDSSRRQAVASLQAYASAELEVELSELQATFLLDHMLADIGPAIYNQATADARRFIEERAGDLEAALHKAEFPVSGRRKR